MASAWFAARFARFARRSSAFDQVFGDRRLRNLEAKLEQFAVDTRCAPERVVLAHLPDQVPQLAVDFRPARPTARSPAPIGPKPCSMPSQDGVGLHHAGQSYQAWPEPGQPYHQSPVAIAQAQAMRCPPQCDIELMPQKKILISSRCRDLIKLATRIPSKWRTASIALDDFLLTSSRESSETQRSWLQL